MDCTRSEGRRGSAPADRGPGVRTWWIAVLPLSLLAPGAGAQQPETAARQLVGEVVYSQYHAVCRRIVGIQDVVVDAAGNAFAAGHVPEDCDRGPFDAFVTKLSPTGEPVFHTTVGGHLSDEAKAVALDAAGNIYITGMTNGSCCRPFPLVDPFQAERGGGADAFVVKLDPTGETILYSTFLGGTGDEWGVDVAVDGGGRILVLGRTTSEDFPVGGAAHQPSPAGGEDAFLTVFDPTGQELAFSTYLGGGGDDHGVRMELGGDGRIFVAGTTSSLDFPVRTPGRARPFQPDYGGGDADAFLARLSAAGALELATYLGGSGRDEAQALALHPSGVYLTGTTDSPDFPTVDAMQTELSWPPEPDAFVTRLVAGGMQVRYSTYLATDEAAVCDSEFVSIPGPCGGIAVDSRGAALVTAAGTFVTRITPAGDRRSYTVHGFGGGALALGPDGAVHVVGRTSSFVYPTVSSDAGRHTLHHHEVGWAFKRTDGINPQAGFEEDDPRVTTTGTWEVDVSPGHSGGAALRSNDPGATLTVTFTAPAIRVYGRRETSAGIVLVSLIPEMFGGDEPPSVSVDAFATLPEVRSILYARSGLAGVEQTLTLEVTGNAGDRAEGAWVWFDGFDLE